MQLEVKTTSQLKKVMETYDANTHFIYIDVPKEESDKMNVVPLLQFFDTLATEPYKMRGCAHIFFNGYAEDPRPIWDIPQLVRYYRKIDELFPAMIFFIKHRGIGEDMTLSELTNYLFMMFANEDTYTDQIHHDITISGPQLLDLLDDRLKKSLPFLLSRGMTIEEISDTRNQILMNILKIMGK